MADSASSQGDASLVTLAHSKLSPLFWTPQLLGSESAWWGHIPFAHWLISEARPSILVELGTHNGVSYAAFCEAVARNNLNTRCFAVDTWEGDPHAGQYGESVYEALKTFHDSKYGAFSELMRCTFDDALDRFADESIDVLHIDGLHTYEAVKHDFESWLPKMSAHGVVLFHDTEVKEREFGVFQLWAALAPKYPHFSFTHSFGLGVLLTGSSPPPSLSHLCSLPPAAAEVVRSRFAALGDRWTLEFQHVHQVRQLADQLELAQAQGSEMRRHIENLETARANLHQAVEAHVERGNALSAELETLRMQLPATSQLIGTDSVSDHQEAADPMPLPCSMRRLCIFSFYDPQGQVDDYVLYFLRALSPFAERTIFLSNGPLNKQAEIALAEIGLSEVLLRPNEGFDVMAYKQGLEHVDFDSAGLYDEVLMVNHTCYGPIFPFIEMFSAMEARSCDFWGVTAHMALTPNPFTGTGTLPYHLNANFIAVRKEMLRSQSFRQYWDGMQGRDSYETAILGHEAIFTEHFKQLGYACQTYMPCEKYGTHYPALLSADELMIDRSPLLKRRALFNDPRLLEHYAADIPRALRVMAQTSDYDQSLIWRNVVRSAELRNLNTNAALTSVLPDIRLKGQAPASYGRIAACVHVYYTDMLEEILALTDTIPCAYDFIATTDTEPKKSLIEETLKGRRNIANVIVRVVEQNRGRDMSALFISCRDLFIDDRYELVCRLHTKKTPHLDGGRGRLFKRHMFENLLHSEGYTANVLDMFQDKPWVGVAVPPVIQVGYGTLGHAWYGNKGTVQRLCDEMRLQVELDACTPIAPFGSMFWFRPKSLHKLFARAWRWTDFDDEPYPLDGGLGHAIERLICYVAQDACFTTMQISSEPIATANYCMLEFKLQRLSATLPNGLFSSQISTVDAWKRRGWATEAAQTPTLPTIRQALRTWCTAANRSLAARSRRAAALVTSLRRRF